MSCMVCELYLIKAVILKNRSHGVLHTAACSKASCDYQFSIPKVITDFTNNSIIHMNYKMLV